MSWRGRLPPRGATTGSPGCRPWSAGSRPGTQLRASPAGEHDLVIAGLLRRLWVKPPPGHGFRPLSDMCDYWAGRYEERSAAERSCLEAPLADEGIRLLRELPRSG